MSSLLVQPGEAGSRGEGACPQQPGERAGAAALKEAAEGAIAARAGLTPEEREPYPQPETADTGDEGTAVVPSISAEEAAQEGGGVVRPQDESLSGESGCPPPKRIHVG